MQFDWLDSLLSAIGVTALLAWLGKREVNRIDALASQKADRAEVQQLLQQIKDSDERVEKHLAKIYDGVADVRDRVSRIEGQLS